MEWKRLLLGLTLVVGMGVGACARPAATPTPAAPAPLLTPTPPPAPGVATPRPTPSPAPVAALTPSGELRLAMSSVGTEVLDPILGPTYNRVQLSLVFDELVGWSPLGKFDPERGVASKWERSPDALTWTFSLRKGVKFHNGDELTAEDAKFTIERVLSPRSVTSYTSNLRTVVKGMEVPDPYTLVVTLKQPEPFLDYYLSAALGGTEGMIVPKKYITEKGEDFFALNPVGSGPYRFVKHEPGSFMRFEALEKHWQMGIPKYKNITFMVVPEETTRDALLKVGQADVISVSFEKALELEKAGVDLVVQRAGYMSTVHPHQQWLPDNPLNKKAVREALELAINKDEIAKFILRGFGRPIPLGNFMNSTVMGFDPALKPYPYDPARSKELLKQAGYPEGFKMDFYTYPFFALPEARSVTESIAAYWDKIGVKAKIIPQDYAPIRARWIRKDFTPPTSHFHITSARVIAIPVISLTMLPDRSFTLAVIPEIVKLVEAVAVETDIKKYEAKMKELQRAMHENIVIFSQFETDLTYARAKKVGPMDIGMMQYELNLRQFTLGK